MAKQTYSEELEVVLERLDQATVAPGGGAALLIRLDTIDKRQEETVDLLGRMNDHVREHGQLLAAHSQWMESHQSIHKTLDKRVDYLCAKINVTTVINTALAFIAGALGLTPNR